MKNLLLIVLVAFAFHLNAQNIQFDFGLTYGGSNKDFGFTLTKDQKGNIYVAGVFKSSIDLDPGPGVNNVTSSGDNDVFIQKFNDQGVLVWARSFGGSGDDVPFDIACDDSNNLYITGSIYGVVDVDPTSGINNRGVNQNYSAYLSKMDEHGNYEWSVVLRSSRSATRGRAVAVDPMGRIVIAGDFSTPMEMNTLRPPSNILGVTTINATHNFIAKYTSNGSNVWAKALYSTQVSSLQDIDVHSNGRIAVTGSYTGSLDLDPSTRTQNISSTPYSGYLVSLDSLGDFEFGGQFQISSSSGTSFPQAITFGPYGEIYCGGYFSGSMDLSPVSGQNIKGSNGQSDIFMAKLSNSGSTSWAYTMGGTGNEAIADISTDGEGNFYLVGTIFNDFDFDPGPSQLLDTGFVTTGFYLQADSSFGNIKHGLFDGQGITRVFSIYSSDSGFALVGGFVPEVATDPKNPNQRDSTNGLDDVFVSNFKICDDRLIPDQGSLPTVRAQCSVDSIQPPTAYSDCAGAISASTSTSFPITTRGTTTVIWTFDDGKGQMTTQSQTVEINDTEPPIASNPNLPDTIFTRCSIDSLPVPTAMDNCDGAITASTATSFPVTSIGNTSILWEMIDSSGNGISQTQVISYSPFDTSYTINSSSIEANEKAASYQWVDCSENFQIISGATNRVFTPIKSGFYAIVLEDKGCFDTLSCVSGKALGEQQFHQSNFTVYPNPCNGVINISSAENYSLTIYSHLGNIVYKNENFKKGQQSIDLQELTKPGVYQLLIQGEEFFKSLSLIVR